VGAVVGAVSGLGGGRRRTGAALGAEGCATVAGVAGRLAGGGMPGVAGAKLDGGGADGDAARVAGADLTGADGGA
jgi:hypothetical protein